jgi:hypothetical protein
MQKIGSGRRVLTEDQEGTIAFVIRTEFTAKWGGGGSTAHEVT